MPRSLSPILITLDRVGDRAQHNAFTDLLFYQDTFYLVYRESDSHQRGRNGVIRFMTSPDGAVWKSEMVLEWEGIDLRDPKLSVTPGGKLMVLTEGIERDRQGQLVKVTSFVFMRDKEGRFEPFSLDIEPGNILWQITWHQGKAWGVSYPVKKDQDLILWSTLDGIHYSEESRLPLEGKATEAAVHFMPDGRLALLVRRDASGTTSALWGLAPFPYKKWQWQPAGYYLGRP